MFFQDWHGLLRVVVVGVAGYAALLLLLRAYGKRTLSKMNAFDFVVTVALGSTLAGLLLDRDVALAEGVLALALLVSLQFVVAWLCVRSDAVGRLVKSDPALLLYRGEMLRPAMKAARVSDEEVRAAARSQGFGDLSEVEAVVLETDGSFSVIGSDGAGDGSALRRVSNYDSVADGRRVI